MADIIRVSITGEMPGGEEWSVNPVYRIGGDFGAPVSAVQAQTIATAIAAVAVPTALLQSNVAAVTVSGCRVEARSLAGVLESQAEATKGAPSVGTGLTAHPFQTSQVISLRTALPGASGRGRLYWPSTGRSMTASTLRFVNADVVSLVSGAKTYLSGISAAIQATVTGVSLVVWSRKNASTANVTSIQSGDIADVQRRRRDALIESYSSVTYP